MARANRKTIDSSNFWAGHWVHGRYTAKPKINAKETRARHEAKKLRLHAEQHEINKTKHKVTWADDLGRSECQGVTRKPNKQQKIHDQIQYGFDIANWWNEQHA